MSAKYVLLGVLLAACSRPVSPATTFMDAAPLPTVAPSHASDADLPHEALEAGLRAQEDANGPADAGGPIEDRRKPSKKLLEDFAKGLEATRDLVDPSEGFAHIVAGPSGGAISTPKQVNDAKKFCGAEALSEAVKVVKLAATGWRAVDTVVCKNLECVYPPRGEWDSALTFRFERKNGRLLLVAIEEILDVPLRNESEKDFAWAAKQRKNLSVQSCPAH